MTEMHKKITEKETLNFIREITYAINRSDSPDELLQRILNASIESTGADSGSIMLFDREKKALQIRASAGFANIESLSLRIGEGVIGWVAEHGIGRIVNDAEKEQDYIRLKEGLQSELVVPMVVRGEFIGVVSVDSREKNAFIKEHEEFLSIMADLAAQIFVNLQDFKLLKLRDRAHRVLLDISGVISTSRDLEEVFQRIMTITEKTFRLFRSVLLLYDREDDRLKAAASVGLGRDELQAAEYRPGEGVTGNVFINRKPVYIPNAALEPDFLNRTGTLTGEDTIGFYCCPIFSGKEIVGVFSTFTRSHEETDESLLEFLEILGLILSQAITIQNLIKEERKIVELENQRLKDELSVKYRFGNMIGKSPLMSALFDKIRLVADSRSSVLITGESGTGKELIVSAIHYNSPRKDGPLVKINCAAIPESLLESELFGHKKGAFTGAIADRKGKFELADGGTIFLDEIGEMDLTLQSKLLRVLQEREIEPVGGRTRNVDVRIIAATNADLKSMIAERRFREDLYYRLNVINLSIPPLRERREDILPLTLHFIDRYAGENSKKIGGITPDGIRILESYGWPGNVRELENAIERAIVLSSKTMLDVADFYDLTGQIGVPAIVATTNDVDLHVDESSFDFNALDGRAYEVVMSELEKRVILAALKKFRYTKTRAAKFLGINRNTLDRKIRELDIEY
jgi:Nif-specific regulatory protein